MLNSLRPREPGFDRLASQRLSICSRWHDPFRWLLCWLYVSGEVAVRVLDIGFYGLKADLSNFEGFTRPLVLSP